MSFSSGCPEVAGESVPCLSGLNILRCETPAVHGEKVSEIESVQITDFLDDSDAGSEEDVSGVALEYEQSVGYGPEPSDPEPPKQPEPVVMGPVCTDNALPSDLNAASAEWKNAVSSYSQEVIDVFRGILVVERASRRCSGTEYNPDASQSEAAEAVNKTLDQLLHLATTSPLISMLIDLRPESIYASEMRTGVQAVFERMSTILNKHSMAVDAGSTTSRPHGSDQIDEAKKRLAYAETIVPKSNDWYDYGAAARGAKKYMDTLIVELQRQAKEKIDSELAPNWFEVKQIRGKLDVNDTRNLVVWNANRPLRVAEEQKKCIQESRALRALSDVSLFQLTSDGRFAI